MKKWIVSDIDGTLTNKEKFLSSKTKEVLLEAQRQGIGLILASGRSPYSMQYFVEELKLEEYEGIGFCFNGSLIYDFKSKQTIQEARIDNASLLAQIAWCKSYGIDVAVYADDRVISEVQNPQLTGGLYHQLHEKSTMYTGISYEQVDDLSELSIHAHKIGAYIYDVSMWDTVFLKTGNPYHFIRVLPNWIESVPPNTSKGIALKEFCHHNLIDLHDVYIFGDGENDIPMFEVGINTVAMANAFPSLKAIAKDETLSNEEDGVAKYISEHLLSK